MIPAVKNILSMTDKTMSDQVDKTSFGQQITSQIGLVVKVTMRHRQQQDPWFDSWGVKILIFQILIPLRFWDILGYIDTHLG